MMEVKSLAIKECEKIPANDKILAGSYEITHEVLRRTTESIFEEHTITIEWTQRVESEET